MSIGAGSPQHLEALRPGSCQTPAASIEASRSMLSCAPTPNSELRLEASGTLEARLSSRLRYVLLLRCPTRRPITPLCHSPAWRRHGAMLAAYLVNQRLGPLSRDQREMSARSLSSAARPSG